jgi:hypothetical protein
MQDQRSSKGCVEQDMGPEVTQYVICYDKPLGQQTPG